MTDDLSTLPVAELRRRRDAVRDEEQVVSFRRRLLQAQLDIAAAVGVGDEDLAAQLARVLADAPTGGSGQLDARSVDVEDMEGADVGVEPLPRDLAGLDPAERTALLDRLRDAERAESDRRRELLDELDALQAELVRRYRADGVDAAAILGGADT